LSAHRSHNTHGYSYSHGYGYGYGSGCAATTTATTSLRGQAHVAGLVRARAA
jgi:hypothetical protein